MHSCWLLESWLIHKPGKSSNPTRFPCISQLVCIPSFQKIRKKILSTWSSLGQNETNFVYPILILHNWSHATTYAMHQGPKKDFIVLAWKCPLISLAYIEVLLCKISKKILGTLLHIHSQTSGNCRGHPLSCTNIPALWTPKLL